MSDGRSGQAAPGLVQPRLSDRALLTDIASAPLAPHQVALWWLGQSGYAIKWRGRVFYFDLYLSEHLTAKYAETAKPHVRMTAAPLRGREITNAALLFATHKHSDHLDPGTLPDLMSASPSARLILPKALVDHAVALGLPADRLMPAEAGKPLAFDDLTATPIPSAHEALDWSEGGGYPYLGYALRFPGGPVLYHPGDTVPYDRLVQTLLPHRIDLALLPINGRDERRRKLGVPGNLTIEEAAWLADAIGARDVIPHHYDMFTFNTADVRQFEAYARAHYPCLSVHVLQAGERFVYPA